MTTFISSLSLMSFIFFGNVSLMRFDGDNDERNVKFKFKGIMDTTKWMQRIGEP